MNRDDLEAYIGDNYSAEPEFPWLKFPNYEVLQRVNGS